MVAIDFYNRPGDQQSLADFVVHMHLAWQNLLHADRLRRKLEIYYRSGKRRIFDRNPDGSKRSWDLARCLKEEFDTSDPIRINVEFFIGLRNHIEHRFQREILSATAPQCHALAINFESELTRRFGSNESLGDELRFPLFIQSLSPADFDEQRELRRNMPQGASNYISEFVNTLGEDQSASEKFAYRLLLIPMKGPKTDADMALNFVRLDDLTDDERRELVSNQGSVIIAEKFKEAAHSGDLLPRAVVEAVAERIPFVFRMHEFVQLRKKWEIGPVATGSKEARPKSHGYCVYAVAFGQFVYYERLVDKIVSELSTVEGYEKHLGKVPQAKI